MPRIRTIKPDFWTDEKVGALKREERLLFIGLWNLADDQGVVKSNSAYIKGQLFSYDEDLRITTVNSWLSSLTKARLLIPFTHKDEGYYLIRTFHEHQVINRPSKEKFSSELIQSLLMNTHGVLTEPSLLEIEGKGNRKEEEGKTPAGDAPAPKKVYREIPKDKKSICDFIRSEKPKDAEPYVDLWNIFATEKRLPLVTKISDVRKKKLAARISENGFDFLQILKKARESSFLLSGKWFGFDWIIENESHWLKIIEGNYDNGAPEEKKTTATAPPPKIGNPIEQEIRFLMERYRDGELNRELISEAHFNHLQARGGIKIGVINSGSEVPILEQQREAVVNYFKSLNIVKNAS